MASSVLLQPKNPAITSHTCFHCHDVCPDEHLHIDDKFFCCDGCKMVYEILNTHNLCEYYALDDKPGKSLKDQRNAKAYAYLDDPEVQEKLLEFNNGETAQVTFYLPNMHCVSCIWLLENLYKLDAGVLHSRVVFLKKTATIQYNPEQTSLRKLAALLSSIGYAPEINLGDVDNAKPKVISKKLAYQIGIAGFAFGNIMLFSFPEYVGMDGETYRWFADVFGYLSLLLALPGFCLERLAKRTLEHRYSFVPGLVVAFWPKCMGNSDAHRAGLPRFLCRTYLFAADREMVPAAHLAPIVFRARL